MFTKAIYNSLMKKKFRYRKEPVKPTRLRFRKTIYLSHNDPFKHLLDLVNETGASYEDIIYDRGDYEEEPCFKYDEMESDESFQKRLDEYHEKKLKEYETWKEEYKEELEEYLKTKQAKEDERKQKELKYLEKQQKELAKRISKIKEG